MYPSHESKTPTVWLWSILTVAVLMAAPRATAQYFDSRVTDKTFEEHEDFFSPDYVNPYAVSGFGVAAAGLVSHPLLDVQVNPAFASSDSIDRFLGYLDFRRATSVDEQGFAPCAYCLATDVATILPWPYPYYSIARAAPEPLVGAAAFGRPLESAPSFVVGGTYQLVFRDESYYAVPYDIYRVQATTDFRGNSVAEDATPIVDGSTGENSMRTVGHLVSGHAAASLGDLDAGLRVGYTRRDIDGSIGNQNAWTNQYYSLQRSLWSDLEQRDQGYDHFDLEAGIRYPLSSTVQVGVSAGRLSGEVAQTLARRDTSYYLSEDAPASSYRNEYTRGSRTEQRWDRDGSTVWAGLDLTAELSDRSTARVVYRASSLENTLASASSIVDTSYSSYQSDTYNYLSSSSLMDDRDSNGSRDGSGHRVAANLRWLYGTRSQIFVGFDVNTRLRTTRVQESVSILQHSNQDYVLDATIPDYEYRLAGTRRLDWQLSTRRTTVTVPVFLRSRLSEHVEVEFGVNRTFDLMRISDDTIVNNITLSETVNGSTTNRDGTTERYREPEVRESDVSTALLAGLSVTPTPELGIRVLMAPAYRERFNDSDVEWRWWIGFEVNPGRR